MKRYSKSPLKPPVHYVQGWRFTVQSHVPPAPTLVTDNCCLYDEDDEEELGHLTPMERCIKHPPLPGEMGSNAVELEIVDPLKVGDGHNSQVFTVRVVEGATDAKKPLPPDSRLVAKVYDPLYYDDLAEGANPFKCMDQDYSHEPRTYQVLSELQGHHIPTFYGSYSLDLPIEQSDNVRTVRLILVEYIPGRDMQQANPAQYSQQIRQQIMKNFVDLESTIYFKNIMLHDCQPRNIIISPMHEAPAHIVLIDFCHALFNRRPDDPLALNIDFWANISHHSFGGRNTAHGAIVTGGIGSGSLGCRPSLHTQL